MPPSLLPNYSGSQDKATFPENQMSILMLISSISPGGSLANSLLVGLSRSLPMAGACHDSQEEGEGRDPTTQETSPAPGTKCYVWSSSLPVSPVRGQRWGLTRMGPVFESTTWEPSWLVFGWGFWNRVYKDLTSTN